jgi:hypothetical protein
MVNYESLLLGGDEHTNARKETALKVARKVKAAKKKGQCAYNGGKMTYEDRLKNLEKARKVRASNLAKKKKMMGKGNYTQDYVDESQINYMGSPLDMYYLGDEKEMEKEKQERGEVSEGGKMKRGRKPKKVEEESEMSEEEEMEGGKMCGGKKMRGGDMSFMKNSIHTGMSMPTEEQFKRGGKIKKGRKKVNIEDIEGGAIDIPAAIKVLAVLASKFGLKLTK